MTYNKKQMQPVIDKYGINPETNKLFIKVCEMFDGQSNYQLWAVRMIFSQSMSFEELETVHEWIVNNANLISKLDKKNVVSYSNRNGINNLLLEIEGLKRIAFIKNIISHFNTAQKKILTETILNKDFKPLEAYHNPTINKWYDVFKAFNKKPMGIKNKFYSTCSALKSASRLHQAILDCLNESYDWKEGKEDLLAFIEHNAKDCEVVFNEGPCVILSVPSFESSHKLCGNGRTGWCISREESYFKSYVTSHSNRCQYFLFDFSRKETDAFAHIGFTIEGGRGIVEAQTSHNFPMKDKYDQNGEKLSIYDVFNKFGIKMNTFMRLPKDMGFPWNLIDMLKMVKENPDSYAVAYEKDGRLIINFLNTTAFKKLVQKTFIKSENFTNVGTKNKIYLMMDFNLPINDERSLVAMEYIKDDYGFLSNKIMMDIYGNNIASENYLSKVNISTDDFLDKEAIDPSIMLHKYINENDELAAIQLIEKERANIDVNYVFNQRTPIFLAINKKMTKLFDAIINHEKFNCGIDTGFGETLLETLLYLYGSEEIDTSKEDLELLKAMITSILNCKTYNLNEKDINKDTALSAACEFKEEAWVVERLVSNKNIDVNSVNDFDNTAISNCIRNNNLEALKLIGRRPDLKVRKKDTLLAKEFGINLDDYIKPSDSIFKNDATMKTEDALEYEFSRA